MGGLGALFEAPDTPCEFEERHGSAGALPSAGAWGPFSRPRTRRANSRSATAPPGRFRARGLGGPSRPRTCCANSRSATAPPGRFRARGLGGPSRPPFESVPQVGARVDRLPLDQNLVVQVRAGRAAGVAGPADDGATLDTVAGLDVRLREVAIDALDVLAVVEHDG